VTVKPGDLIEWAFTDGKPVLADETLWSSTEKKWVPIGSSMTHLCVSCDDKIITWLNEKGLFRAREDDTRVARRRRGRRRTVVPRSRR
jgi:hypothetical protein